MLAIDLQILREEECLMVGYKNESWEGILNAMKGLSTDKQEIQEQTLGKLRPCECVNPVNESWNAPAAGNLWFNLWCIIRRREPKDIVKQTKARPKIALDLVTGENDVWP